MAYLLLACQFVLAFILLLAATGKFLNIEQFLAALRLSYMPKTLVIPLAVLTPIVEICLAFGLVFSIPVLLPLIMVATSALLVMFTVWMIIVYARGLRLRCGCFGSGESTIGPHAILRNIFFIALLVVGFVLSMRLQSPLSVPSFWMIVAVSSLGMCLMLLRAFQHGKSALVLSLEQLERIQVSTRSSSKLYLVQVLSQALKRTW